MMDTWPDWLVGLTIFLTVMFVVVGMMLLLTFTMNPRSCAAHTKGMGVESEWTFWGGCRVNINGMWVPLDNVRVIEGKIQAIEKAGN